MNYRLHQAVAVLALLLAAPAASWASGGCLAAASAAEREAQVPAQLLAAIGIVESGRPDPLSGRLSPWPWSVNVDGAGFTFDNEGAAEAFVADELAAGARHVDVGCFQVDLEDHPDAFATLKEAFDPVANAAYAARLLARLHAASGSWQQAVALYHSADPARGWPYRDRVLAFWKGKNTAALASSDPVVVIAAPAAAFVRVITPGSAALAEAALPPVFSPD